MTNYLTELEKIDDLLEKDSENVKLLLEKSSCLRHLDRYDEAIIVHDKLISLEPENMDFIFMKGILLIECERCEESVEYFDRVLKKDPNNRDALFNKGLALKAIGNEIDARECMRKAITHPK